MTPVEVSIRNDPEELAAVAGVVDAFVAEHGIPAAAAADVRVALDEVLTNVIVHGCDDGAEHRIRVRLALAGDAIEAEVEDDGRPFNPLLAPPPDLGGSLATRRVGGLGIHFVRRLMSDVRYSLVDNRNRLLLVRRLDRTEADRREPA